ncbi:hypothetical protein, variant [Sphaeroforma arctica JP610]|uniref:Adenosylmethionine-8-amino-7-oxononanoate aminotransferase n=1 Tax=Sphaeroforma arctica JP610 TaxID=667725 RepID=A0A0L0FXW3_9EUKA|nr:hypothetical protein, variant [Sphaeroforma arctica JP610]KNC81657.1 hypothetical protein, variant [Sphaeroforma arctica JP610]|eukprot:XP_014155559.1 hypothetical protein, variant [Sphaeroforma arctica JP610]
MYTSVPSQLGQVHRKTLHFWDIPASPHISARAENRVIADNDVITGVKSALAALPWLREQPAKISGSDTELSSMTLVETAGGVLSPSATIRPQADVYRPLRLPVVLIGDPKLGGISSTLSAYESLIVRGYDVVALAVLDDTTNSDALTEIMRDVYPAHTPLSGTQPLNIVRLPEIPPPEVTDLSSWYATPEHEAMFDSLYRTVCAWQADHVREVTSLQSRGEGVLWWPFTQHQSVGGTDGSPVTHIDSALDDDFHVVEKNGDVVPLFDSCASWWTQGVGHGNVSMATSLAYAAGRYGHVIFPENVHTLAVQASEEILKAVGGKWGERVFFTDNGSTAVEVAVKMAFKKYISTATQKNAEFDTKTIPKLRIMAQSNCYHGDTLGVMNVAEPSVFTEGQHPWFECKALSVDTPTIECVNGKYHVTLPKSISGADDATVAIKAREDVFSLDRDNTPLYKQYTTHITDMLDQAHADRNTRGDVGALMVEPVLLGAGGMMWIDPLFQRAMIRVCRQRDIPVIFDEVFAGFWRLGCASTTQLLGVDPDISCYAKLLTGGVIPMSVTVASADVFDSFLGDAKADALLHGHSYTAHPMGCASVLTALQQYKASPNFDQQTQTLAESWDIAEVEKLSGHRAVHHAFSLGTVCVVALKSNEVGYSSTAGKRVVTKLRQEGVFARPLGNVVYLMCAPVTPKDKCTEWLKTLNRILESE